eukprot:Opistho-1_new@50966
MPRDGAQPRPRRDRGQPPRALAPAVHARGAQPPRLRAPSRRCRHRAPRAATAAGRRTPAVRAGRHLPIRSAGGGRVAGHPPAAAAMNARTRPGLSTALWTAYEHLAMVVGLGSLALICLAWLPLALVLRRLLPPATGVWLGRQFVMRGFRGYLGILSTLCACRFDLSELDGLGQQGPMVIAANHPSLLDAVMINSRLPNAVCVMKAELPMTLR